MADRGAWGERTPPVVPELGRLVDRLRPALAPLGTDQLVHGDLTGNVLLLPDGPPGIIDFSPYWRPPSFAEGAALLDEAERYRCALDALRL